MWRDIDIIIYTCRELMQLGWGRSQPLLWMWEVPSFQTGPVPYGAEWRLSLWQQNRATINNMLTMDAYYILGWLLFLWFDFGGGPIGVVTGPCLLSITSSLHHRKRVSELITCLSGRREQGRSSSLISSLERHGREWKLRGKNHQNLSDKRYVLYLVKMQHCLWPVLRNRQ